MKQTFEQYLQAVHDSEYAGASDEAQDNYEGWVGNLDGEELMAYAETWGAEQWEGGHITGELKERKTIAGVDFTQDLENLKNI